MTRPALRKLGPCHGFFFSFFLFSTRRQPSLDNYRRRVVLFLDRASFFTHDLSSTSSNRLKKFEKKERETENDERREIKKTETCLHEGFVHGGLFGQANIYLPIYYDTERTYDRLKNVSFLPLSPRFFSGCCKN